MNTHSQLSAVAANDIVGHVNWLCGHADFEASERLKRLLAYLAERGSSSGGTKITQRDIATAILGQDPSFDPAIDSHVRVEIKRLRDALRVFYAEAGRDCALRIKIPRGQYNPVLVESNGPAPALTEGKPDGGLRIGICAFAGENSRIGDLAEILHSDIMVKCQRSALASSGVFEVVPLGYRSEQAIADFELPQNMHLIIFGTIRVFENELSAHVAFFDTANRRVIFRDVKRFDLETTGKCQIVDNLSQSISTLICDPIGGPALPFLASVVRNSKLTFVMRALEFKQSQDIRLVDQALFGLSTLNGRSESSALVQGLTADLMRVATNARIAGHDYSAQQIIDKAESAVAIDGGNVIAQLAAGYAYLNAGERPVAAAICDIAQSLHSTCLDLHDAMLLKNLSVPCSELSDPAAINCQLASGDNMWTYFANLVALFRQREFDATDTHIVRSPYKHIFWTHLFHSVVRTAVGEPDLARLSAQRLKSLVPDAEQTLGPVMAGYFSGQDLDLLLDDLNEAGLRVSRMT